jgi:hypothetical protein
MPLTARWLFVCSGLLLLFANGADGRGAYQRTKDGQTLVWNNYPESGDKVTWSGDRDQEGYAVGDGTLTWYKAEPKIVTGSNIPTPTGPTAVVARYSGKMVRGKLDGPVVTVNAKGMTLHATFVEGTKIDDWKAGPAPRPKVRRAERIRGSPTAETSAQGSTPTAEQQPKAVTKASAPEKPPAARVDEDAVAKPPPEQQTTERVDEGAVTKAPASEQQPSERVHESVVATAPTPGDASIQLGMPPSSLRMPVAAASPRASVPATPSSASSQPSSSPAAIDPAVKNRMITDFKDETQSVLSRVSDATGNFHVIDRLESVKKLPAPVSERVGSLVERARDFRSKIGYETALQEYRTETETVDALSVVDQITRNIANKDTSAACSRLTDFLKNNPEPAADSQKPLWRYLTSMRSLCSRSP